MSAPDPDHADHVHSYPVDDLIEHELSPDCVCGPACEPVPREDGSFGWVYRHHSLDGREQREGAEGQER